MCKFVNGLVPFSREGAFALRKETFERVTFRRRFGDFAKLGSPPQRTMKPREIFHHEMHIRSGSEGDEAQSFR